MSKKRTLFVGTFILTATGFLSRLIGFFFRMFLSHTFGEEQVGLYQLTFPLYALCFSLTAGGIETAIARCTARKITLGKKNDALKILYLGLGISLLLSFIILIFVQGNTTFLATQILGDARSEPLLLTIVYAIPFASVHSCICGYYFGQKQTKIPALSQLIEQVVRVASVYCLYLIAIKRNWNISILYAIFGIVIGECCSSFFCVYVFTHREKKAHFLFRFREFVPLSKELMKLSVPLTGSRVLLNVLQSVEAISIPLRLQQYGYSVSHALSNYGVLTGMALPCILFPSAITNSVSTMLLPTVAEIQATKDYRTLKRVIQKVFFSCFSLGMLCCLILVCGGSFIGRHFFHSQLAGDYLKTLAWICPFLYLNTTLSSMNTGLGMATASFVINLIGLSIRIIGVLFLIPVVGMNGYLWGLLLSQLVTCVLFMWHLTRFLSKIWNQKTQ